MTKKEYEKLNNLIDDIEQNNLQMYIIASLVYYNYDFLGNNVIFTPIQN